MGRASWIPGKSLDFIPRLAGTGSLCLQLESMWTLVCPGDQGPLIPILLIPGVLPKMTMQSQKDTDARNHPFPTVSPRPRAPERLEWEGMGPSASLLKTESNPGLQENPQWTRRGMGTALIHLPGMGPLGGETGGRG